MVIRSSSAREVQQLVAELRQRIRRARRRLPACACSAAAPSPDCRRSSATTRAPRRAAVGAQGARGHRRSPGGRASPLAALHDTDDDVRVAAIAALRRLGRPGRRARCVMDALVTIALERRSPRASASRRSMPSPSFRATSSSRSSNTRRSNRAPADGDDAGEVQEWLAHAPEAPLSALHALITHIREREGREPQAARRREWLWPAARCTPRWRDEAAASRSTICGKPSTAAQAPLPLDFLTAVTAIGDAAASSRWPGLVDGPIGRGLVARPARRTRLPTS